MHPGNGNVIVIGDVMLDVYVSGEAWRISPEAPVPVVAVNSRWSTLGGAGNVALNLIGLGCKTWLFGAISDDHAGNQVMAILRNHSIQDGLQVDPTLPTTTKTRVMANNQQLVRFDDEGRFNGDNGRYEGMVSSIAKIIVDHDIGAVILSDYNKGVLSKDLVSKVMALCQAVNIPILVDPKRGSWDIYAGATVVKPNLNELREATNSKADTHDEVLQSAKDMMRKYDIKAVLVTMGSRGMLLVTENRHEYIPTMAKEVFDVSGAGDTVIATLAAFLCSGKSLSESAVMANRAAGIVVGKLGTHPITLQELLNHERVS